LAVARGAFGGCGERGGGGAVMLSAVEQQLSGNGQQFRRSERQ